jgi:rsbT antagonist protein RsbS
VSDGPAAVIRLYGNLIVPVRVVSDDGIARLREEITARLASESATGLVLDVSGLEYMDSFVTRVVRDLAVIARLMGVTTVLSGVSPDIAVTIVEMGLDLPGVVTALNLERALEQLARLREEESRELDVAAHLV